VQSGALQTAEDELDRRGRTNRSPSRIVRHCRCRGDDPGDAPKAIARYNATGCATTRRGLSVETSSSSVGFNGPGVRRRRLQDRVRRVRTSLPRPSVTSYLGARPSPLLSTPPPSALSRRKYKPGSHVDRRELRWDRRCLPLHLRDGRDRAGLPVRGAAPCRSGTAASSGRTSRSTAVAAAHPSISCSGFLPGRSRRVARDAARLQGEGQVWSIDIEDTTFRLH